MGKDFVLKAVKKIAAVGAGAVLLASTLTAATALDLGDFPAPFVENGQFDTSTVMVIGEDALGSDTFGVGRIELAFQQASRVPVTGGGSVATVEGGVAIEKVGDKLNLGDWLGELQDTTLKEDDLPTLLADGFFSDNEGNNENEETYTQELEVVNGSSRLVFESNDDDEELTDVYLRLYDNSLAYTYTLDFDTAIEYDNTTSANAEDDFEGTVLMIQGNSYTITDVETTSAGIIDRITTLAGETVVTLEQGEEVQGITVDNVNENEDICVVLGPDGSRYEIDEGTTEKVDGILVGVIDVIAIHQAAQDVDICKLAIGATKVVFDNGDEIEVNGNDVQNSKLEFIENTPGELEGLNITYELDDDEYMPSGSSWRDPVLGNFELTFASWSNPTETIELVASGEEAEFTFMNPDGKEVVIPLWLDTANDVIYLGEGDEDERLVVEGQTIECSSAVSTYDDCEGVMLFVVDSGENAHIIEIENMDSTSADNPKVKFTDLTYNKQYEEDLTYDADASYDVGSGTITLNLTSDGAVVATDLQLDGYAETVNEAVLAEMQNTTTSGTATPSFFFVITENDDENNEYNITLNVTVDTSDDELEVEVAGLTADGANADYTSGGTSGLDESKENDDVKWYATEWGSIISRDADDPETWVKVEHPATQGEAQVVLAPTGAAVTTSTSGGQYIVVDIQPDQKIYPTEITDVSNRNAVLVGGPCANPLVEEVSTLTCQGMLDDFTSGEAVVELVKQNGKYALIVAGRDAIDTRRAATMLLNYDKYATDLDGKMSVIVKGTTADTVTEVA